MHCWRSGIHVFAGGGCMLPSCGLAHRAGAWYAALQACTGHRTAWRAGHGGGTGRGAQAGGAGAGPPVASVIRSRVGEAAGRPACVYQARHGVARDTVGGSRTCQWARACRRCRSALSVTGLIGRRAL